eukprot:365756-Chlamydomonas_euryale.AAC.11
MSRNAAWPCTPRLRPRPARDAPQRAPVNKMISLLHCVLSRGGRVHATRVLSGWGLWTGPGVWGLNSMCPAKGMVSNTEFCDACTPLPLSSVAGNVTVDFVSMSRSPVRYHGDDVGAGGGGLCQLVRCSSASRRARFLSRIYTTPIPHQRYDRSHGWIRSRTTMVILQHILTTFSDVWDLSCNCEDEAIISGRFDVRLYFMFSNVAMGVGWQPRTSRCNPGIHD